MQNPKVSILTLRLRLWNSRARTLTFEDFRLVIVCPAQQLHPLKTPVFAQIHQNIVFSTRGILRIWSTCVTRRKLLQHPASQPAADVGSSPVGWAAAAPPPPPRRLHPPNKREKEEGKSIVWGGFPTREERAASIPPRRAGRRHVPLLLILMLHNFFSSLYLLCGTSGIRTTC